MGCNVQLNGGGLIKNKGKELKFQKTMRGKRVKYVTDERLEKVNPDNIKIYEQYLKTNIVKNKDVKDTTYRTYKSYMNIFLVFIMENFDNFYLLDEEFVEENMIDVMEAYMAFLQDDLNNGRKAINTKIATVSSFYMWAVKRRKIRSHPFSGRLDRMKNAQEEKLIAEYFLSEQEIEKIKRELYMIEVQGAKPKYDWIDRMIWTISYDSACRIGALSKLTVSSFDEENNRFINIREKRGKIVSIPLTPDTTKAVIKFLEYRKSIGMDSDWLFATKRADGTWTQMTTQTIHRRVKRIGEIIGIGDFRPHCIRKSRLNQIAKIDINMAKSLANHESLDTTARFYTEKVDQSDVLKTIMELEQQNKVN